jgi:hypothetical protein
VEKSQPLCLVDKTTPGDSSLCKTTDIITADNIKGMEEVNNRNKEDK